MLLHLDDGQVDLGGLSCVETHFALDSLATHDSGLGLGLGSSELTSKVDQQLLEAHDEDMSQVGGTKPSEIKNGSYLEATGTRLKDIKETNADGSPSSIGYLDDNAVEIEEISKKSKVKGSKEKTEGELKGANRLVDKCPVVTSHSKVHENVSKIAWQKDWGKIS